MDSEGLFETWRWQQVLAAENVLSAVGLFAGDGLGVGSKEDGTNQAETKVADGFSKWATG